MGNALFLLIIMFVLPAVCLAEGVEGYSIADVSKMPVTGHNITIDKNIDDWVGRQPSRDNTAVISKGEFIFKDATADDTGTGNYSYATNKALHKGSDLKEVRVTYDKDNLYLLIVCDRPGDWWAPYRLIGIDQDGAKGGRGGTTILAQGEISRLSADEGCFGELRVSADLACEYVVGISQTYKGRIWNKGGNLIARCEKRPSDTEGFKVDDADWRAVEVAIPLKLIGGSPEGQTWRFIVATSQQDYDVAREIEEASSEWHGGGGEESDLDGVDPDYYDLASPDKEVQEKELNSYRAGADPGDTDAFATINESYLIVNFGGYVPM